MTPGNSMAPATESAGTNGDPRGGVDPLLHLHKMSTTAGVGSQEYVEVNPTSVVAVVVGLASLLAVASPVLLVIPVTGVVLSWVALRQIRNSNGTQTGGVFAIMGLIFSGVITASIFTYQGWQAWQRRADQNAIAALSTEYGADLNSRQFADAYTLFDSDFQNRWGKQRFINQLTMMQRSDSFVPPIEAIWWNGLAEFHENDGQTETADAVMIVKYKKSDIQGRMLARFRRVNGGQWQIDNIEDEFPPERGPAPAQ